MDAITQTRQAQCPYCKRTRPSTDRASLPFFEDRGPGTMNDRCAHCRYNKVAHGKQGVSRHVCDNFAPMVDGYEYDSYYCGCRGWD